MTKKQTSVKKKSTAKKVAPPATLRAKVRHHAKHTFIPHKANEYRPHLIRPYGLAIVLAIALFMQTAYGFATTGHFEVLGRISNITTADLLNDTNAEREAEGLSDLALNDELSQAAFLKGQDMLENDYWAHVSPNGVTPWKWFGDVGYNYSVAGENLAKNYPTADATVAAWMASESHRDNILNNRYLDVGFAVVDGELNGKEVTIVVAMYGAPVSVSAVAGDTTTVEFAAPVSTSIANPVAYMASALQSLSPVTILVLGLFAIVAIVAVEAHHYRDKLPKSWRKTWRLHHGAYTFTGMLILGVLVIIATGGGSI